MKVAQIQGVSTVAVNAASATLTTPARDDGKDLLPGDLLLAVIGRAGTVNNTPSVDWTEFVEEVVLQDVGVDVRLTAMYHYVTPGESSSQLFQMNSTGIFIVSLIGISLVESVAGELVDGTPTVKAGGALDNTIEVPAITTSKRNSLVFSCHYHAGGNLTSSATLTPPAGMTELVQKNTGALATMKQMMGINYKTQVAPGSTGVMGDTCSNNTDTRAGIGFAFAGYTPNFVDAIGR